MFWDRRIGDRRDRKPEPKPDPDRRGIGEGVGERRNWTCGILYRTSLPAAEIEQWLERNTSGKWGVGLEGMEESLNAKVLKIMFEREEDKYRFMAAFSRR